MSLHETPQPSRRALLSAAILCLLVVTAVMLLSLMTQTAPHPPLEVPPFALAPFLGASLGIGMAALTLVQQSLRVGFGLALLFAATGLVSFGPQKYLDPAIAKIWPAVITAQLAILVMVWLAIALLRQGQGGRTADGPAAQG